MNLDHNWRPIDTAAAVNLTALTNSPGVIYLLATSQLPAGLQKMPGVCSYFISGQTPVSVGGGLSKVGEAVVARVESATTKNYNYLFALDGNGGLYINGPYKGFGHYMTGGQTVEVSSLFGQSAKILTTR